MGNLCKKQNDELLIKNDVLISDEVLKYHQKIYDQEYFDNLVNTINKKIDYKLHDYTYTDGIWLLK